MSINISKQHREELLGKIWQIRSYIAAAPQDANTGNLLQYLDELAKDVKDKKYGLVFEEHRETIDELLETHTPVLTEQKELFIDNGGEMNFLIEGDNLAALKLLKKTHKGGIDIIYIDPPYNTGNEDFMYDDCFVDSNDTFRHSKWLSFMEKRLRIAKQLLSRNGAIFISIDDNEQSTLKMLCDDVFDENNQVNTICIKMSELSGVKMSHINSRLPKLKEYCIVYAQNSDSLQIKPIERNKIDDPEKFLQYSKYYSKIILDKTLPVEDWEIVSVNSYCKQNNIDIDTNEKLLKFKLENADKLVYRTNNKSFSNIKCNKKLTKIISSQGHEYIWWEGKQMLFLSDYIKTYEGDLWTDISTINLNKEGDVDFPNGKKPLKLLQKILQMFPDSLTILDFFAGSGTTGHAVMKLNAKDDGHRKFILCTNNEKNICRDVTYERLRTVIAGKRKDGSDYPEQYKASLKYYKIDYVPISDKLYYEYADELLLHVRELVELENGINFRGNNEIAIVLTDDEMEQFVSQADNKTKVLYRGHDVLLTGEQEEYIKAKGITVNVIPDYYYNELN